MAKAFAKLERMTRWLRRPDAGYAVVRATGFGLIWLGLLLLGAIGAAQAIDRLSLFP